MIAAAIAASSAREMVMAIPTLLKFKLWNMLKQGWYTPNPVSCPSSCFLSPVLPILYFTGQVQSEPVSGRVVRALGLFQGTGRFSGALWVMMKVVAR